jgi:NADH-quinone oxidoreductase subunit L
MAFHHPFIDYEHGAHFWGGAIAFDADLMHHMHDVPLWVKLSPAAVMLFGLFLAWNSYIRNPHLTEVFTHNFRAVYTFLYNKWYFDELYEFLFVRPALWLGRLFWKVGDEGTIDRFGPNGVAAAAVFGNRITARIQSGYLYTYALVMLLGIAAATTWAMAR